MIRIDTTMPTRCADCPCYSHAIYGHCKAKNHFFKAEEMIWKEKKRPDWCPLMEEKETWEETQR